MNKKFTQVSIVVLFFLTACSPVNAGETPVATSTLVNTVDTTTLLQIPTNTTTSIPTETPTASITPLSTIPIFTPTLDGATIVTVTPAQIEECPEQSIDEAAQQIVKEPKSVPAPIVMDLTNDGLSEIILSGDSSDGFGTGSIYIIGCKNSSYMVLKELSSLEYPSPQLWAVRDLNGNGMPEIVIAIRTCGGFGSCWTIYVLEWSKDAFQNIADEQINQEISPWLENLDFRDIDQNGITEIIVSRGLPSHPDSLSDGTWREYTEIYSWNGRAYVPVRRTLAPAQFRFQAIQDADDATARQNYDLALSLYQDAIFSDKLEWWSFDRYLYYKNNFWISTKSTAVPTPYPDSNEYPKLAAYAYYRIMLIHILQGHESDAGTVFKTLQQKFGNDPNGRPYVEMANEFWSAYQSTQKLYDGCAAAMEYAAKYPDILAPLGSDYHGRQSHFYEPADVCPFR